MPGSARAMPVPGAVKFVPSMRNWFSFVADPNADTVVLVPLPGDVAEIPGAILRKSDMPVRRVGIALEVLVAEASRDSRVSCFHSRARSLDDDRCREARQLQDRRSLDAGARPDVDVLFVIAGKPLHRDVEHVPSWRQSREA